MFVVSRFTCDKATDGAILMNFLLSENWKAIIVSFEFNKGKHGLKAKFNLFDDQKEKFISANGMIGEEVNRLINVAEKIFCGLDLSSIERMGGQIFTEACHKEGVTITTGKTPNIEYLPLIVGDSHCGKEKNSFLQYLDEISRKVE